MTTKSHGSPRDRARLSISSRFIIPALYRLRLDPQRQTRLPCPAPLSSHGGVMTEQTNPWHGRRVLVTGVTGFLGGAVARELLARGAEVVGLIHQQPAM